MVSVPVPNLSPRAQSLREVVRDDSIRPKMRCLMMDSSFSMVTVQGEDSGIAWETTPSRCGTPWAADGGGPAADPGPRALLRSPTPAAASAGKIIFVMDEEMMSRRKRSKEIEQKRRQDRQREGAAQSSGEFSERPELVEVSLPNVKSEEDEDDVPNDPPADRLFSLVSEGSEILNIIVPTKLATVDEEESREMVDNLSYLDESPLPKASEDTQELQQVAPAGPRPDPVRVMDPPGAPVARPPRRRASGPVDYFEAYSLIDAQAPGGPAVIAPEEEPNPEVAAVTRGSQTTPRPTTGITADPDKSDTVSLEEFTSELLDEVFYGGTEEKPEGGPVVKEAPSKGPSKPSGSILFGGEEDVLTPIFLPDGPPKIIDPILLEEPKAMAFLYTDLYEEAMGCRTKDEDAESVGSEKSFHSRYSDREARGYLEKYVLIDETPVVEMEAADKGRHPEEGPRVLSQDLYDYSNLQTKPEKEILPDLEEEVTDFFRSSASSSPCDLLPFDRSLKAEEAETTAETKEKTQKVVSLQAKPDVEDPVDAPDAANFECPYEELDWGIADDHLAVLDVRPDPRHQEVWRDSCAPVAPPRKKASSPKTRLDLSPLTPVDVQEKEEASGKEQGNGEKETEPAPQAKTGKGDGGESQQTGSVAPTESLVAAAEPPQRESARDDNLLPLRSTASQETEGKAAEQETREAEAATEHIERVEPRDDGSQKEKEGSQMPTESAKEKGRCVIL